MSEEYTIEELGQIAFDAYGKSTGGLTWDGKPIPPWETLPDHVRMAWMSAAFAVKSAITGETGENQEF